LSNPFHLDGLAADLDHALSLPLEERRERHQRLAASVAEVTPAGWARGFLTALSRCR
jgi:trehalose 6-phosphate synthase